MLNVYITVDRAAAILAGLSKFGPEAVQIDPAELDERQRGVLAKAPAGTGRDGDGIPRDALNLTRVDIPYEVSKTIHYPSLARADKEGLLQVIDTAIKVTAEQEAVRVRQADEARRNKEEMAQRMRDWMSKSDDELLVLDQSARWPRYRVVTAGHYDSALVPGFRERMNSLEAEMRRRNEDMSREEARQQRERKEAEEAQRTAQLAQILAEVGTESMRRRAARNLLPEQELLDAYRERLYAPLESFPRFVKLKAADVYAAEKTDDDYAYDDPPPVEFGTLDLDGSNEEEFATFEAVERVAVEAIPVVAPGAEVSVTMQQHAGGLVRNTEWSVYRKSIKVAVKVGQFEFSRLYACP